MERKNRNWLYLVPVAGAVFCLWYLYTSFYDVVYSDYIRLVNSYLPDVWNPAKFWVPDLLTRVPVNFLARIINTTFFHYSIRFDQVLGVVSLALSAVSVTYYVNRKQIGTIWFLAVMAVMFSLNKWEMLNNGSGWVHFLAFAGFYYHYQIWDRVWGGEERKGDHLQMILLPWILILAVAGPYCAVYVAVLIAGYAFCMAVTWKREKRLEKRYLLYGLSVLLPFFCYLWSNAQVVPDWSGYGAAQGSLFQNLFRIPGYFIRFVLKSLASVVTGQELAKSLWSTNLPYLAVGIFVAAAYLMALYLQFSRKLYETTVFPMVMLVSGALNHALILLSRWSFLVEDYGMSSRYALQFQVGVILSCEAVPKSKKLLCSQVQVGSKVRQIISGIKHSYSPEEMVGKRVMVVTNLKPAKLAGLLSEGMILCAEDADGKLSLMTTEKEMPAGAEIC